MGRTLLGIDLDESPVGGLIEGLLSDEDLEKLTDGGRDVDDEHGADSPDDPSVADDAEADVGTGLVDDAVESGEGDRDGATRSESGSIPVGTSGDSDAWDSPSPDGPDPVPSPGAEDVDDEDGGWKAKLRPVLLKATAALAVLAVVAFLAYRYLGKARSVASDKLGSDDEADSPPTTGAAAGDAPEARRRAKAPDRDDREEFADRPVDETVGYAERAASGGESDVSGDGEDEADDGEPDTVGRPAADSDVGALVGLAALALVAAVVRKFGEDREYDPLVDGPADDRDDE
ncbi:hypothetical protein [Halosimplex halophilum]|uniref:hypothetical protein n=1 Tax=Halosimplex halophilum TaxID=2559572 RepID=UPI00107EFF2E|nr:hypothetical protein [Halosimplex halophilum]